jgi:hypothetical protein
MEVPPGGGPLCAGCVLSLGAQVTCNKQNDGGVDCVLLTVFSWWSGALKGIDILLGAAAAATICSEC